MINLHKAIKRKSGVDVFEAGKLREIVVSLLPTGEVGFRLEGTRDTFTLPIAAGYQIAVKAHVKRLNARAKVIKKSTGKRISTCRKEAEKELKQELRGLS